MKRKEKKSEKSENELTERKIKCRGRKVRSVKIVVKAKRETAWKSKNK